MNSDTEVHRFGTPGLGVRPLLITIEGVLHNRVLVASLYRHLFWCDMADARMVAQVRRHLTQVLVGLVGRGSRRRE